MADEVAMGRWREWLSSRRHLLGQTTVALVFVLVTLALARLWGQSTSTSTSPQEFSNFEWQNGISVRADAGFFVPYSEATWEIAKSATTASFAASGSRVIENVTRDERWIKFGVSGSALDPVRDGHPNIVQLTSEKLPGLTRVAELGMWLAGVALLLSLSAQIAASRSGRHTITIAAFGVTISFPMINSFTDWIPQAEIVENRKLATAPEFSVRSPEQFTSEYNKYFNDHFSLRNNLVKLHAWVKWNVFRSTPLEALIAGKRREVYYYSDVLEKNHSIANYRHRAAFSEERLKKIWGTLRDADQFLRARNIGFTFLIAPDKANVNPEMMPDSFTISDGPSIIDQILKVPPELGPIQIMDIRRPLLEANHRNRVYFRYGTHWNDYGALIGFLSFHSELRKAHPELPVLSEQDFKVAMKRTTEDNLLNWVGLHTGMSSIEPVVRFPDPPPPGIKLPKLVLIHDSFYEKMLPFLYLTFEKVVLIHHGGGPLAFNSSAIEQEHPTHVMLEVTERFVEFVFPK